MNTQEVCHLPQLDVIARGYLLHKNQIKALFLTYIREMKENDKEGVMKEGRKEERQETMVVI